MPVATRAPAPVTVTTAEPVAAAPAMTTAAGPWKIQLGAFGQPGNADRQLERMRSRSVLSGTRLVKEPEGRLTKVMAVGFASRAAAQQVCNSLKSGGQDCLVTR